MYYTASSVKKALQSNKTLSTEGLEDLGCPQKEKREWAGWDNAGECPRVPQRCSLASRHDCKQRIHIFYRKNYLENKVQVPLAVLNLRFTISSTNNDGYIDKDDNVLGRLINRDLIDVAILQTIQLVG